MKQEYLRLDFGSASAALSTDRRDFLKIVGGGILVLVSVDRNRSLGQEGPGGFGRVPKDLNAFLRIGEDGRVTCFTGKIEMGQGIVTSLAQMLAEELDVPLESVDMVIRASAHSG